MCILITSKDRGIQMLLLRAISQGRLSECFASDETTLMVDTFMRRQGFHHSNEEIQKLAGEDLWNFWMAYSEGVNYYL